MADIIDAFIVTLGLDGSNFKKGEADTKKSLRSLEDESSTTAKEMEKRGKQAAQFFASIKVEALSLLAVLTAGAGLKSFVTASIDSSAQLGRLAHNVDSSTEALSAWEGAAARSGGTAESMAGTFRNVSTELAKFKLGLSSDFVQWFARAGGDFTKLKEVNGTMIELSQIVSDLDKKDPGKALLIAKNLGIDENTFNFLRRGPQYVQEQLEAQKRLGVVTEADAQRAQQLQARIEGLRQSSEKLGRDLLTKAAPALEWLLEKISDLAVMAQKNGPAVAAFFTTLAVAAAIPFAEVIALTAAVAAIAVVVGYVYQEWQKWMEGSESSLSGFFQFFADGWKAAREVFGNTFKALGTTLSAWFNAATSIVKAVGSLFFGSSDEIRAAWSEMFKDIGDYWTSLLDLFSNAGPAILQAFKTGLTAAFSWAKGRVDAIWGAITGKSAPAPAPQAAAPSVQVPNPAARGNPASPRGIRNNNPGNLNFAGQTGATKEGGAGGRFAVFSSMDQGIAALGRQLQLYSSRGIDTIQAIVQKYAPAADNNNVQAYVRALVKETGVDAGSKLDLNDLNQLISLMRGIINHENGSGFVSNEQISAGARLAARGSGGGNTASNEVKIGTMTIHTQATDAQGIARDAQSAFRSYPLMVPQSNTGIN